MSIKNIKQLRDHALNTLERLDDRDINIQEAAATAKIYSSIISSVKAEMDYHKMLEQKPKIEFLDCANVYEGKVEKPVLEITDESDY